MARTGSEGRSADAVQYGSASTIGGQATLLLLVAMAAFVVTFRRFALNRV
jgi:hypothetical protein